VRPFSYKQPKSVEEAIQAAALSAGQPPVLAPAQFIAGGTNMSDYMKLGVMEPEILVDLNRLRDPGLRTITVDAGGIRFGALVRMAEAEEHPQIKADYPLLAEALKLAASGQIRNMASLAGNVLQRTRCEYFRETSWACNKRKPGSGCAAMEGVNRQHAVLGVSEKCIAIYHGDFAQALIALDAKVDIAGPAGKRTIAFANLHRQPGDTPQIETTLKAGEVITAIQVPAGPHTRRSHYLKIRDRQSYAFALAAAAVALDLDGTTVRDVRIALGGIATIPWRASAAETILRGKRLDEAAAMEAAEAALAGAAPRKFNAYKIPLAKQTLVRALIETRDMTVT
jgi:xanthine dehydrogenase YagS FAD-binding subunit